MQLYITRSVVNRYGGTVEPDPATKAINVTIPGTQGDVCAQEIEKQVGAMFHYVSTQIEALASGEILIRIMLN